MTFGDRKDGRLLRELDSLHFVTGVIYPNRCDNEAFISETIDLTNINDYLKKKNYEGIEYKYNLFQIIVCAMSKVITLRPKMNRFIVNGNFVRRAHFTLYRRNGPVGVRDSLTLCDLAYHSLAGLGECDNGRSGASTLCVCDNDSLAAFHNGNAAVSCTEVNTYNLTHNVNPPI